MSENHYSYSDYQVDLLDYQTTRDSQEIIISGGQSSGYSVEGYLLNQLVYYEWSDLGSDTTAVIQEADFAINELIQSPY